MQHGPVLTDRPSALPAAAVRARAAASFAGLRAAGRKAVKERHFAADSRTVGRSRLRIRPVFMKKGLKVAWKFARKALLSGVLLGFLGLCLLGWLVGRDEVPHPVKVPMDQLFDQLQVYSYRDTPSDTNYHFVVELTAFGKPFAEYDVDQQRFVTSGFGRRYDRAFSGAHYTRLKLRGHSGEGSWIALPDSSAGAMTQGQFDELTRKTLDYVRPVGVVTNVLGLLSGYSVGYRLGLWEGSLANPTVQKKLLETPGIARTITREAWRRVLLEPAFMSSQPDAGSFGTVLEQQRLYNRFFLLALEDTSGFVAEEAARLARAGQHEYAQAMTTFAASVRRANSDSTLLASRDFRAIETWAGMLFSRGHWARFVADSTSDGRFRYLGALAHYNLSPPEGPSATGRHARQVWVGPRALVTVAGEEGYIADEIPATVLGCPSSWKPYLLPGATDSQRNLFAVRWVSPPGAEFLQVAKALRNVAVRVAALAQSGRRTASPPDAKLTAAPGLHLPPLTPGRDAPPPADSLSGRTTDSLGAVFDSLMVPLPDTLHGTRGVLDTLAVAPDSTPQRP